MISGCTRFAASYYWWLSVESLRTERKDVRCYGVALGVIRCFDRVYREMVEKRA